MQERMPLAALVRALSFLLETASFRVIAHMGMHANCLTNLEDELRLVAFALVAAREDEEVLGAIALPKVAGLAVVVRAVLARRPLVVWHELSNLNGCVLPILEAFKVKEPRRLA